MRWQGIIRTLKFVVGRDHFMKIKGLSHHKRCLRNPIMKMDNKQSGDAVAYPLKQSTLVSKVLGKESMIIDFCLEVFLFRQIKESKRKFLPALQRKKKKHTAARRDQRDLTVQCQSTKCNVVSEPQWCRIRRVLIILVFQISPIILN